MPVKSQAEVLQSRRVFARNPRRAKVPNPSGRERERDRESVEGDGGRKPTRMARCGAVRVVFTVERCRYPPPACKHASPVCIFTVCAYRRRRHTHTLGSFKSRCTAVYIVWRWCTFPNVIIFARGIARAFVTSAPRARVFLSIPFFPFIVVGIRGVVVAVVADFLVSMLTHSTRVGRMNKKKEREKNETRGGEERAGTVGKNSRIETARGNRRRAPPPSYYYCALCNIHNTCARVILAR